MYSNYNFHYLYYILFLLIQQGYSQRCIFRWENGTELTEQDTKYGLNLRRILDTKKPNNSDPLLLLFTENVEQIIDSKTTTTSDSGIFFLKPSFVDKKFNITLADEFVNYENLETRDLIRINVFFQCTSGVERSLEILQLITDTNNHYPEFVNAPYRYSLSMPFPKNIPLHLLAGIAARDIDLTNTNILFFLNSSDPNSQGFYAAWSSADSVDKKRHNASLITTAVINLGKDVTFNIYAKDSAENPLTTSTTISIIVDRDNSIMKFTKSVYIADYTQLNFEEANGTIFLFKEGNVTLGSGVDNTVKYYLTEQSGEYQQNFVLKESPDHSVLGVMLINPPKKFFNESFVLLTLSAKKPGAEETTTLHISLPGKASSVIHSTTPTSPTTSNPNDEEPCYCTDCTTAIIVLSVFLVALTIGLSVSFILNWRRTRLIPKVSQRINGFPETKEEMEEVVRDARDTNPVSAHRRSVAFNDIVEEIRIARL